MTGVVTLTPLGAIDATYRVTALEPGELVRANAYDREVSGKGVNLAAALTHGGVQTRAVVVLGDDDLAFAAHSPYADILRPVPVPGATRVNTSLIDAVGVTTKVNAPSPSIDADAWQRALGAAVAATQELDADWLVVCGTFPVLTDGSGLASLDPLLTGADLPARIAVDTSGPALTATLELAAHLDLVKPNTAELAELVGRDLGTVGEVVDAARELVDRGIATVYVSMGADGALAVTADRVVHAHARPVRLANTAGAGDASLAGFLAGSLGAGGPADDELTAAIATAASWGAHAVAQPTTILPGLDALPDATVVDEPDRGIRLTDPAVSA